MSKGIKETEKALKRPKGDAGLDLLFSNMKYNSKKRGIDFSLTKEELKFFTSKDCGYCGRTPYAESFINIKKYGKESTRLHGLYIYTPLDRLNSDIGYTNTNVIACCKQCNFAKHTMSIEEFKEHIIKIYRYLNLKDIT